MKIKDVVAEEKQKGVDGKACWDGYKRMGTKKKGGKTVDNCVKMEEGVVEGLGYSQDPEQAKWYHRGRKAQERGDGFVGDDIRDIAKRYGCPPEWLGAFRAGYQDQEGWSKKPIGEAANAAQQAAIAVNMKKAGKKPKKVDEDFNPEYDDEAGMANNNLETLERAIQGIDEIIQPGDNLPEWCQEKIAVAKSMLVTVWDYMKSEEQNVGPDVEEMYEALEQFVFEVAQLKNINEERVWKTLELMDDNKLYETAAWRRSEGKSKKGGLNAKGVASYRREHPGSKLQMAVTTKPSKLKKGSKAAKRRKSFCARMSGVKGPMEKNGKPTRKALALRKWNC